VLSFELNLNFAPVLWSNLSHPLLHSLPRVVEIR